MKKYLLFLFAMFTGAIGAWAENATITGTNNDGFVITVNDDSDLSELAWPNEKGKVLNGDGNSATAGIKVIGNLSSEGLTNIINHLNPYGNSNYALKFDLSEVTNSSISFPSDKGNILSLINYLLLPSGVSASNVDYSEWTSSYGSRSLKYIYGCSGEVISFVAVDGTYTASDVINNTPSAYGSLKIYDIQGTNNPEVETLRSAINSLEGYSVVLPYDGTASAVGGTIDGDHLAGLPSGTAVTEVKDLTVTGTLSAADVTYITTSLTGLTDLNLTGANLTATQLMTLLNSTTASISVTMANISGWGEVGGQTVTPDKLDRLTGVTASDMVNNFTSTTANYVVDGKTLNVTGNIDATVDGNIATLLSNQKEAGNTITTLDVSKATNTSAYTIAAKDDITVVSLPSSGNVTYAGTATALVDGTLTIDITGSYASIEAANSALNSLLSSGDVEHVKVTGTLKATDLGNLHTLGAYTSVKTLDLSGVTLESGTNWSDMTDDFKNANVLLPDGTDISSLSLTNGNIFTVNGNVLKTKKADETTYADYADGIEYFAQKTGKQIVQEGTTTTIVGTVDNTLLASIDDATGTTRLDMSKATIASGSSIENLEVPSTLTSLVLPKGETVTAGGTLAGKLAAVENLKYAYSPTTGVNAADGDPEVADYIWVIQTGGLSEALTKETATLSGSKYVKVAGTAELSAEDVDFSGKITNLKYLDFRNANFATTRCDDFTSPGGTYRIILPDNWATEQMAVFAAKSYSSAMAAVYSYQGTDLKIYEIADVNYMPTALANPRIVYSGTTSLELVGTNFGTNLLAAINNAASSVTSLTVSTGAVAENTLTFNNPNLTTLDLSDVNTSTANLTIGASCTNLTTLILNHASLNSINASGRTALKTVNMEGSTVEGVTNLSGSGLTTITTNATTWFKGDLNLASTALTSFTTSAKMGTETAGTGNISLNAASSLTSLDLHNTHFQNSTSQIHVHATDSESETDVLSHLNDGSNKTIVVPTGFDKKRLHPNDASTGLLNDNIEEQAPKSSLEDDDGCYITYNTETNVATVHATTAGHFKALYDANASTFAEGTRFVFDNTCELNKADLLCIMQGNKYYVDLYEVTNGREDSKMVIDDYTTEGDDNNATNIDKIVEAAVADMVTNSYQAKGIILPLNSGSGTSKMEKANGSALPTFTEYAAYYRSSQKTASVYVYDMKTHYYKPSGVTQAQANFETAYDHLKTHSEFAGSETVIVGTNNVNKIDLSTKITTGTKTEIVTAADELVNEANRGLADIYVATDKAGKFKAAIDNTNIDSTPCEKLFISGPVNGTDITAVNSFGTSPVYSPKVLNLKDATGLTASSFSELTNAYIQYVILPVGWTKDAVSASTFSATTGLKAAISSSTTNLVAYVREAGSLAEARYYATGGSIVSGLISPTVTGLTSVTLSGNLNAADIAANTFGLKVNSSGHWYSGDANASNIALSSEQGTITSIDLRDAVFSLYTDMKLSYAGLSSLTDVKLPIASTMDKLPEDCLNNIETLKQLCIPSNYKVIEKNALFLCGALTIITDNDAHTLYIGKNGESFLTEADAFTASYDTYTLSKNITNIATGSFNTRSISLSDIYVMASTTPKCEKDAFAEGMYVGWKGFTGGDYPYCREKYRNGLHLYTILHYPAKSNTNLTDADYEAMEKNYTDVTKIYTKKEQTGAKDANGREIVWPTFPELRRVFAQASDGLTWYDWPTAYTIDSQYDVNDTKSLQAEYTDYQEADESKTYDFNDYIGWHQFVLTMASNYEPSEEVVNNKINRRYVDAGYYTFCIPFDMTLEEVIELMGVPASDNTYNNYLDSSETPVTESIVPEIYQLKLVTRKWANTLITNDKNVVKLILTENLYNATSKKTSYLDFASSVEGGVINITKSLETLPDGVCLKGGRPYIIKAYKRQGETIKSRNLGQFIMNEYGNKFKLAASCVHNCFEQLGAGSSTTLQFAKPYENHKVQAMMDSENGSPLTYNEDNKEKKYYYTMIGQFWTQKLPLYCIYMSGDNNWYRYDKDEDYNWQAYKCVIMASKEGTDNTVAHYGGGYRQPEGDYTHYPTVKEGTTDQLDNSFKLGFLDGRDDDDFDTATKPVGTRYIFAFDDGIVELDEEGNEVTAIEELDGEIVAPLKDDNRVYNMQGQYVGQMNNSLGKGMYIVNGKKIVVK